MNRFFSFSAMPVEMYPLPGPKREKDTMKLQRDIDRFKEMGYEISTCQMQYDRDVIIPIMELSAVLLYRSSFRTKGLVRPFLNPRAAHSR